VKLNAAFIGLLLLSVVIVPTDGRAADDDTFRVTLLGSGIPVPSPDRFGPSTLVEAGGHKMLFDAGRGATIRLFQLNARIGAIEPLFLTHFHSDHTVGIPDLWLTGWLGGPFGRRETPFRVIGPIGAKELMQNLERAYAADVRIRIADEKYPREGAQVLVEEFSSDGVVYDKDGVRVSAFEVDHGDAIKPAYGYRIDFRGRSAVISGDTRYNENVVRYGSGADLLIHEVGAVRPELLQDPQVQRVMAHHTSPQDAGRVFSRAHPKLAVYTHLVLLDGPKVPALSVDELVAQTRETYNGPLVIGQDLMAFEIANDGVKVIRPK